MMAASMKINKLSRSVLDADDTIKRKRLRENIPVNIEHTCTVLTNESYSEFFERYLMTNRPCILPSLNTDSWNSRKDWTLPNGKPNFDFLRDAFGKACVPVANCRKEKYSSQLKEEKIFSDFLDYWQSYIESGYSEGMDNLYLKDWHFIRDFPKYKAYEIPCGFSSDWLNEFWDTKTDKDDYRFVYMGPKGSWFPMPRFKQKQYAPTLFRLYCGGLPRNGEEENLHNKNGHLVYDVNSADLHDANSYPNYSKVKLRIEVIQEAGEIIYVPSGWHHQVYNLEDTISINHNWLNGCNVDICWQYIKDNLIQVQREIEDCRGMEEWDYQCQLILKANCGIDYEEFLQFMEVIAIKRIKLLRESPINQKECGSGKIQDVDVNYKPNERSSTEKPNVSEYENSAINMRLPSDNLDDGQRNHCVFDLYRVKDILNDMIHTPEFISLPGCQSRANMLITDIEKITNSFLNS